MDKSIVWYHGEVKSPPFTQTARLEAGLLLRRLQQGENLRMPHSRPMPDIGQGCHELRIRDQNKNWRIIYRVDDDAIVVVEVYPKTTRQTSSKHVKNG
jgi:phage-related protein